jgi:GAF domain-containing protein
VSGPEGPAGAPWLPELAGLPLSEQTVSDLLDMVVALAVSAVEGVDEASVSVLVSEGHRFETANASSALVRAVDEAQYQQADGPCVEAIRSGQEVPINLPAERWPHFSGQAVRAGMASVWSLPLKAGDRTTGALNLYSKGDRLWDGPAAAVARALAAQGGVVLANATSLAGSELVNRQLELALDSRDVIGQAKGIIMAREGVSADEAFDILRRASQRTGAKLRDIAGEVVAQLGQTRA